MLCCSSADLISGFPVGFYNLFFFLFPFFIFIFIFIFRLGYDIGRGGDRREILTLSFR